MTAPKTHTPTADAQAARELLLWLRANRIICTDITVGSVHLAVNDMELARMLTAAPTGTAEPTEQDSRNLYAEFGGKAIDEAAKEEADTYEDDD